MDELNLTPDAVNTVDSTAEIEGYDDQIEKIEQAYPEEDFRTPAERAAQEESNQQTQPSEPVADSPQISFEDIANLSPEQLQSFSDQLGLSQQQQPQPKPKKSRTYQ